MCESDYKLYQSFHTNGEWCNGGGGVGEWNDKCVTLNMTYTVNNAEITHMLFVAN